MRTDAYWAARMDALNEALLGRGEAYIRTMNAEYGRAAASIQRDIDAFYQRFAFNNSVDLASARQILKAGELREFKWTVEDYIKAGRENAVDQRWMKELENASIRVRVSRLEALQLQMRQHVETLTAKRHTGTAGALGGIYKDGYYRTVFELQQGVGIGSSFAKLDSRQVDKLLVTPWAPDGSNFSARIWGDRTKLVAELQTTLTQGLIRGDSSDTMIDQIQARMGVSRSAAASLVLTESAYFAGQSRADGYRELGVESYKFTATLDRRTSTICRDMDGKVFQVVELQPGVNYPPLHVRCRSTTIPHYEDNVQQRAARGDDGKTYDVPGDMTYKEWAEKNVPPDSPAPEPPKPKTPPASNPIPAPTDAGLPAPRPFQPARSIKEAEEAARRDYGFDDVDFAGMDLENANDLNKAINIALREFPSVKGFVKTLKAVDTDEYVAQMAMGLRDAPDVMHAQLTVSTHYYNVADIDDTIKASVDAKYWPAGSNRQSVFIHEFGHVVEYAHALKLLGGWTGLQMLADEIQIALMRLDRGKLSKEIVAEALAVLGIENTPQNIVDELSQYAATNSKETLAEAVAEAVGTDNPRRLAVKILEILKRRMKEAGM
ncbi:minor capsid protein [Cohnella sp. GCM10012308]|uniref:minor capsid protein n=1 Tax=Cohnella sp. GCM10012308 TaxID=3317329 RepID=UPI0036196F99